jgi:hypothetical protein
LNLFTPLLSQFNYSFKSNLTGKPPWLKLK